MTTVVVGDLHGQWEIVDEVLSWDLPTVFVGDYLDSYTRTPQDQIRTLETVLDAVEEDPERVTGLFGNHELSYMYQHMRCSGWKPEIQEYVDTKRDRIELLLQPYVRTEGFLISHAGVSQKMLDAFDETIDEYLDKGQFQDIGRARGGRSPVGGLYWCDWNWEFIPLEDTPQIVGHTRGNGIRETKGSYCIDCLEDDSEPKVLLIEEGKAKTKEVFKSDN